MGLLGGKNTYSYVSNPLDCGRFVWFKFKKMFIFN
ncbi:hypothetical protein [Avibacterium paragallinarum]